MEGLVEPNAGAQDGGCEEGTTRFMTMFTRELPRTGARRRRGGGGPGEGCARRPVGTYLYLHAVGAGNPIAVPSLAR
jgi:hypothetical protein